MRKFLSPDRIQSIVELVPEEWLTSWSIGETSGEKRMIYARFLETRIANSHLFVKEAQHARKTLI
jgi:hypothetical protein